MAILNLATFKKFNHQIAKLKSSQSFLYENAPSPGVVKLTIHNTIKAAIKLNKYSVVAITVLE